MKAIIFAAIATIGAGALLVSAPTVPSMDQVGYFKSPDRNRVMAYRAGPGSEVTQDEAHSFLANVMHTDGQLTYAVIYRDADHPGHALTSAPSYLTAVAMLEKPHYDGREWGVEISPSGKISALR